MPEPIAVDAVFESGGVKGIALVGAAEVVAEAGYRFARLAGTSAGAIVAALLAAGYTPAELRMILLETDLASFLDGPRTKLGQFASLLVNHGIHPGARFRDWIAGLLMKKRVDQFRDLPGSLIDTSESGSMLRVIASDLTRRQMLVLPDDAAEFGVEPGLMSVADAVRMSMSIPYLFRPVSLKRAVGAPLCVVDGAITSDFPVELFDDSDRPTIGFRLVAPPAPTGKPDGPMPGPFPMTRALAETAMWAHDARAIAASKRLRSVEIPTLGYGAIDFGLPREAKLALYESGRSAARRFLETPEKYATLAPPGGSP